MHKTGNLLKPIPMTNNVVIKDFIRDKVNNLSKFLCNSYPDKQNVIKVFLSRKTDQEILAWILTQLQPNKGNLGSYIDSLCISFGVINVKPGIREKIIRYFECFITVTS